jgi:hypothetical protein
MVKVSEVVPFSGMLTAPKALVICGGEATVRFAEAVLPVPPFVDVTLPVVLVNWPEAAPVTLTTMVHGWAVVTAPPDKLMLAEPATAVTVAAPQLLVASPFGVLTISPVGSASVNATPVNATVFAAGLVIVKVNEVVAFSAMLAGLKTLAMVGGATTGMLAEAVPPVPPSVEVTLPVVLF